MNPLIFVKLDVVCIFKEMVVKSKPLQPWLRFLDFVLIHTVSNSVLWYALQGTEAKAFFASSAISLYNNNYLLPFRFLLLNVSDVSP